MDLRDPAVDFFFLHAKWDNVVYVIYTDPAISDENSGMAQSYPE